MPVIPQVQELRQPIDVPRISAGGTAKIMGEAFQAAGVTMDQLQAGADAAESQKLTGEGTENLSTILQEAKQKYQDPEEYRAAVATSLDEAYAATLGQASNSRVRRDVEARLANNKIQAARLAAAGYFEKKKDRGLADLDVSTDQMSKSASQVADDKSREAIYGAYGNLLGKLKGNGFLSEKEAADKVLAFDKTVLTKRANALILIDTQAFFTAADKGDFNRLGEDVVVKLREAARDKDFKDERRKESVYKATKYTVMQEIGARANSGALLDAELNEMLDGKHPYVSVEEARTLKNINDNPPTGAGSTEVRAIMQDYHSGPSSFGRINAARNQLSNLMKNQAGPNPLLDKAFNELQTDERTMTGIDASRINRDVTAAKEKYDSENPKPMFNIPGADARRQQDKAKVGQAVRQGKDPTPIIQGSKAETKAKVDAIPQKMKDAMGYIAQ